MTLEEFEKTAKPTPKFKVGDNTKWGVVRKVSVCPARKMKDMFKRIPDGDWYWGITYETKLGNRTYMHSEMLLT